MNTMQPIRDRKQVQEFKEFFRNQPDDPNALRNYTLVVFGLNTLLTISEILNLTWEDVFSGKLIKSHIIVKDRRTGKEKRILLNSSVRQAMLEYYPKYYREGGNPYIFPSPKKENAPLSRYQAYRIIRRGAEAVGLENVSCNSLWKTLDYHAWRQGPFEN